MLTVDVPTDYQSGGPDVDSGSKRQRTTPLMPLEKAEEINKPFSWTEPFNYASKLLCGSRTSLDMPGWYIILINLNKVTAEANSSRKGCIHGVVKSEKRAVPPGWSIA